MSSQSDLGLPTPSRDSDTAGEHASSHDLHQWKLPRGRHGLPPELVARSQRERLLAAVVRVTAKKGYRASSVADILKEAGVGRETFYRHFNDKEDCFLAANDALIDDLEAYAAKAYNQPGPWSERMRWGLAAILDWFAVRPETARVMMIEMGNVGPVAGVRFGDNLQRFIDQLEGGRSLSDRIPELPNLAAVAGGSIFACVYEHVTFGTVEQLPKMLPQLTFEVLLPYAGEKKAARERLAAEKEMEEKDSSHEHRAGTPT